MVHVISKQDGPRKEEARLRHVVQQNRGTIEKIADTITGGALSARAKQSTIVPPEPASRVGYRATSSEGTAQPYVRISLNGRVVVVDFQTGRQLHHLGDLRGTRSAGRFVLATKENGFYAPLEDELRSKLSGLDGAPVENEASGGDAEDPDRGSSWFRSVEREAGARARSMVDGAIVKDRWRRMGSAHG